MQQATPQNMFIIERAVVPCDYELTLTLKTPANRVILGFHRVPPPAAADAGVVVGSIVVEEGGSTQTDCTVGLGGPGVSGGRLRFRVAATSNYRK